MKFALFFLLTCTLTPMARAPIAIRFPLTSRPPAAKRVISNVTWTRTPVAGLAESRRHPARRGRDPRRASPYRSVHCSPTPSRHRLV